MSFSGKEVHITVGYSPRGGFHAFASALAERLPDELRGNPKVSVSNEPGANTLLAVRSVTEKGYRDNRVDIVVLSSSLIRQSILGNVEGFAPASDLAYLGAPDYRPSGQTWCIRSSVADSLDGYFAGNHTLAQIGNGSDVASTISAWMVQVGFPFDRRFGYVSPSDLAATFNQGGVDATPTCGDAQIAENPDWADGYATPLFYTTVEPEWVKVGKAAGKWAWVRPIREVAQERFNASNAYLNALDAVLDSASANRIFAVPAQTPPQITRALRDVFERVVLSDEFADGLKSRGYHVGLQSGSRYQAQVEAFAALPTETLAIVRGLFPEG